MDVKQLCTTCGFMVVMEGHESRCRVSDSEARNLQRRRAWLGDVRHTADVRMFLLCSKVQDSELQCIAQKFVSRVHQVEFYNIAVTPKEAAFGTSLHSISTAFEASYHGHFRYEYLLYLHDILTIEMGFVVSWDDVINDHLIALC
jgi:hypothetical protein